MKTETPIAEILLAEDNLMDVTLVREALSEYKVPCVLKVTRDGEEAITLIESLDADPESPRLDLLLLDMHLPKRDGGDILKRLRSTGRYAKTPVIVMTGVDARALDPEAASQGPLVYFQKPSSLGEFMKLGSLVRRVLALDPKAAG